MIVTLTWPEYNIAGQIGSMRHVQNVKRGAPKSHAADVQSAEYLHRLGARGECAAAKHFGIFWMGDVGVIGAPDVGQLEVRTTENPQGSLILKPQDRTDAIYVLVIARSELQYELVGAIRGTSGKDARWWDEKKPVPNYFVPISALDPVEKYRDEILGRTDHRLLRFVS